LPKHERKKHFSAQLAQRLFLSSQAVGKWERGESLPDIITLNHLAEILGVDLNYFSENFQSAVTEMEPSEFIGNQSAEIPSRKLKKELNWICHGGTMWMLTFQA